MIKLLNAGFTRLRKSKLFWQLSAFSVGFALLMIYNQYSEMKNYESVIQLENLMFYYSTIVGIAIAIFTSLFLGVEYSDGAIRNKISIGHKRSNIYLSNLIIVTLTSLFSYIVYLIVITALGIPLFGFTSMSIMELLKFIGCIFMIIISFSSIFVFLAMIIANKTINAVVSIILSFGLLMGAALCLNILDTPEYINSAAINNGTTEFTKVANPKYPSETKIKVCQTLADINPAGQGFQIVGRSAPNMKILPIYSLGILVIFTGVGLALFRKKELK